MKNRKVVVRGKSRMLLTVAPLMMGLAGTAHGAEATGSVYIVTYVEVLVPDAGVGAALIKQYRDAARRESGNLEAEAGQEMGRPNRFVIIEGWRDAPSFDDHAKGEAAIRFRDRLRTIRHNPSDQRVNHALLVADATKAEAGALMVATHVDVIPPRQAETEAALKKIADDSRKDAGNLRYDVFQQEGRLNHFNIVAVWQTRHAFDAHEATAHRLQFRDTVAPMLGALYDERLYKPL
jgi:quinol monooxygenase YgiN